MRLKFWKKDEDYPEYILKRPRQKKTMRSVAEKLVMKEMENSHDIELAQKVLKISRPPAHNPKLSELLEEYFKNEEMLGRGGGQGGGTLERLLNTEAGKVIAQNLTAMVMPQGQPLPPAQQPQQEQLVQPQEAPAIESKTISPLDLVSYFDYESADAVQELKGMAEQGDPQANALLTFLKEQTYGSLVAKLEPFKENPEYKEGITELLSPERKAWLSKVINLAKE